MPRWVRTAEIVLGLVSLLAGLLVIAYPGLAFFTLVAILAVGLIFLGSRDIVLGAMGTFLPGWLRIVDIVFGVLAFVLSVIVLASPGVAVATLVIFLYFALFVRGIAALTMAGAGKMFPTRLRAGSGIVGVLSILLAVIFLAFPALAIWYVDLSVVHRTALRWDRSHSSRGSRARDRARDRVRSEQDLITASQSNLEL